MDEVPVHCSVTPSIKMKKKMSEKPMASQTKWHRDCDLDEKETDWKKNISAYKNMH